MKVGKVTTLCKINNNIKIEEKRNRELNISEVKVKKEKLLEDGTLLIEQSSRRRADKGKQVTTIKGISVQNVEKQIDEIINKLLKGEVLDLYKNSFLKKPLAKELFVTGINPERLTQNDLQASFKNKSLVFYPSLVTCEIFYAIAVKYKNKRSYMTACKGIGKSFSLALFVTLFRMRKNTRIFYVQNSYEFAQDPIEYFTSELHTTYPEELKALKCSEESLKTMLREKQTLDSSFKVFFDTFEEELEKRNDIDTYIIFDQIDELQKIKDSKEDNHILALSLFQKMTRFFTKNQTIVMMSSATNEKLTMMTSQEIDEIFLKTDPLPQAAEKYMKDELGLDLTKKADKIKYLKIDTITQGYFLLIDQFMSGYRHVNPQYPLDNYIISFKEERVKLLVEDIQKFFDAEQIEDKEREEIRSIRKSKAINILNCITNDMPYQEYITLREYDTRHFTHDLITKKMKPIHSLVVTAYRQKLSDVGVLKSMIMQFAKNASVLGFILQNILLVTLPNSKIKVNLNLTSLKDSSQDVTINLSKGPRHDILDPNNIDLTKDGLYTPLIYNFALYDAFIRDRDDIFALQITKYFKKSKVNDLAFDGWKQDPNSIRCNTKASVRASLNKILQNKKISLKTVLISVGQNPKDEVFADTRNSDKKVGKSEKKNKDFFYLDATEVLRALGFENEYIKILGDPSFAE